MEEKKSFEVNYFIEGNLESENTIFFLNGLFHGKGSWIKQRRFFSKHFKLVFLDYRGCGTSSTSEDFEFSQVIADIRDIFEKEQLKNVTLVGYSIGGMFATVFASEHPDCIDRLVLLNTATSINQKAKIVNKGIQHLFTKEIPLESVFSLVYPWYFSAKYAAKLVEIETEVLKEYAKYNNNRESLITFLNCIGSKPNLMKKLSTIKTPTLVVGSDEDIVFPPQYQREIKNNLLNSDYHELPMCGHSSFIEQSKTVNHLINNHISLYS